MRKNFLARMFEAISETIMGAEKSFLDLLSALVPYCVPVIPAYLTYFHTWQMMGFPTWVAWTAAFVVEALGLTSVATAIRFYRNNQLYKKTENRAPFTLAVFVYIFYIVIVLAVNVVLEIVANTRGGWIILAIGLFTLLGVPSAVLISIRTQYAEMLEHREVKRTMARGQGIPQSQVRGMGFSNMGPRTKYASDYKDKIIAMLDDNYTKGKILELTDITARLGLEHSKNKGYVSTLRSEWKRSKGIE